MIRSEYDYGYNHDTCTLSVMDISEHVHSDICLLLVVLMDSANCHAEPWFVMAAGLTSQQWGHKKAAAKALTDLAEAGGDALPPHTPTLISTLLQVRDLNILAMCQRLCSGFVPALATSAVAWPHLAVHAACW